MCDTCFEQSVNFERGQSVDGPCAGCHNCDKRRTKLCPQCDSQRCHSCGKVKLGSDGIGFWCRPCKHERKKFERELSKHRPAAPEPAQSAPEPAHAHDPPTEPQDDDNEMIDIELTTVQKVVVTTVMEGNETWMSIRVSERLTAVGVPQATPPPAQPRITSLPTPIVHASPNVSAMQQKCEDEDANISIRESAPISARTRQPTARKSTSPMSQHKILKKIQRARLPKKPLQKTTPTKAKKVSRKRKVSDPKPGTSTSSDDDFQDPAAASSSQKKKPRRSTRPRTQVSNIPGFFQVSYTQSIESKTKLMFTIEDDFQKRR